MKLRQLRVCGFKSFADRTEFDFRDGVTVVVGPNGCGKSNVVDAVKWTLGEQSAKSLRGKEMLDVIFNGAVGRRPAAFAETTLVFENTAGLLRGQAGFVEVSRRLYRSGESEYLLNGQAARLRDLKELFMGTGVGTDAYSIIEQGKVDILLAANPQERRLIFEEAAGISRYKARKREAARKLERVAANLGRVADVSEELQRRLRSLRSQAGKARAHQELAAQLGELRRAWSVGEYHRLGGQLAQAACQRDEVVARQQALREAHGACDAQRAKLAAEVSALERELSAHRVAAAEATARMVAHERAMADHRRRDNELTEEIARERTDWLAQKRRLGGLRDEGDPAEDHAGVGPSGGPGAGGGPESLEERLAATQEALADAQRKALAADEAQRGLDDSHRQAAEAVVEWARQAARLNNELAGVVVHEKNLRANQAKLTARAESLRDDIEAHQRASEDHEARLAALDSQRASQRETLAAMADTMTDLTRRESIARQRRDELDRQLAAAEGRRSALREDPGRRDTPEANARAVLAVARAQGQAENVGGLLADFVRVAGGHTAMLEAALGPHLTSVLVRQSRPSNLTEVLANTPDLAGPARFVCADRLAVCHDGLRLEGAADYLGRPLDFVEIVSEPGHEALAGEVRSVLERLLARTIVAASVAGAMRLAALVPRGYRFVTPQGEVLDADGSLELVPPAMANTTGHESAGCQTAAPWPPTQDEPAMPGSGHAVSPLARRDRLRTLETRINELRDELRQAHHQWEALSRARQALAERQGVEGQSHQALESQRARQAAARDANIQGLAKLAGQQPGLEAELAGLARDLAALASRREQLEMAAEQLETNHRQAVAQAEERAAAVQGGRAHQAALAQQIADYRVAASSLMQKRESLAANATQIAAARQAAHSALAATGQRIARACERRDRERAAILAASAEFAAAAAQADSAQAALAAGMAGRHDLPSRLKALEVQTAQLASELQSLGEVHQRLELGHAQIALRIDTLVSRFADEVGGHLPDVYQAQVQSAGALPAGDDIGAARGLDDDTSEDTQQGDANAATPPGERPAVPSTAEPALVETGSENLAGGESRPAAPAAAETTAARLAELDAQNGPALQAAISDLRGRLERLGHVNLDSLRELGELEARWGRLSGQVADLHSAQARLEDLIARIDTESARLFTETFAQVRTNFAELFRKLFGGGRADVYLEDEARPLECGIEIVARPPGKEPRNISLLSGGEKTMTAVAMLLAVFRSRPSPFCILDEVDAALDESNTHRFGGVLREFTDHSQFIVISHRKPTMSVADVMYGVTMQETGVSKKVAVRFNDHGEVMASDESGRESRLSLSGA